MTGNTPTGSTDSPTSALSSVDLPRLNCPYARHVEEAVPDAIAEGAHIGREVRGAGLDR
ncbi:MAG: hypothetical protein JXE06_06245 [Coriobacteriia bacterium]|nr:hypothetical protein [Coriobacteriia bacterium]